MSSLTERLRAHAEGRLEPAVPRLAATVVLLRDGASAPEALLLRRRSTMPFAPGMHAFPGGRVDPGDRDLLPLLPPGTAEQLAARLGGDLDPETAAAALGAALRETFEEAGALLLPGPAPVTEDDRRALAAHETTLAALLTRLGRTPDPALLRPWARWITPEFEPRRYDTLFFVARLPQDAPHRVDDGESDHSLWTTPEAAVRESEQGRLAMLPPTLTALRELAGFRTAADALRAADDRPLAPVTPRATLQGDALRLEWDGPTPGSEVRRLPPGTPSASATPGSPA
ncbi:hypothetical protein BIV57_08780 [Mangrovactinospora gilvigrisea]|uniref:Nudix hydrolase domain-containing protein n=1 Tax=Mangrovactinospora gilvigrisea TaxID=1428644 RepID=A0A1J7BWK8_9ACTN|nr:hypothetical protein [Mangrovactinospora gilvigrisea]OIV37849.1 hypothetical protein BIV57_08780 [Mangrovactinospora gilvigrisea]